MKVEPEHAYSRAPITGIHLSWWQKDGDAFRRSYRERRQSKLGQMARLRGQVEAVCTDAVS